MHRGSPRQDAVLGCRATCEDPVSPRFSTRCCRAVHVCCMKSSLPGPYVDEATFHESHHRSPPFPGALDAGSSQRVAGGSLNPQSLQMSADVGRSSSGRPAVTDADLTKAGALSVPGLRSTPGDVLGLQKRRRRLHSGASTAPPGSTRSTRRPSSPANSLCPWGNSPRSRTVLRFRACDMESNRNGVSSS